MLVLKVTPQERDDFLRGWRYLCTSKASQHRHLRKVQEKKPKPNQSIIDNHIKAAKEWDQKKSDFNDRFHQEDIPSLTCSFDIDYLHRMVDLINDRIAVLEAVPDSVMELVEAVADASLASKVQLSVPIQDLHELPVEDLQHLLEQKDIHTK